MAMERREFLDLCPAHALGLLDGEDLARFERELASADPEMLAAYREAVNAASNLSLAAPPAPLSPAVLDTLMQRVQAAKAGTGSIASRSAPGGSRPEGPRIAWIFPFRIAASVAVGLALLSLGLIAYASSLRKDMSEIKTVVAEDRRRIVALTDSLAQKEAMLEVLKSDQMQMVVMKGQEADPVGYGKIIWDPVRKQAILHVSRLPAQPADKDYQLWVIRDSKPVDAGVFRVSGNRKDGELYKIDRLVETDRGRINAFAITLEPKGGLPQPSGKMYLLGSI
ncbi:MAG: anti-sigma-K factor RskA [Fibrobacteres bacterium]|nr:anti-sigma-K factor RskA [Fibrobacterota bacterium]